MPKIQYAAPLYIVREECRQDLFGVLRKLRSRGFEGIEFLGFFGHGAGEVRAAMDELGLKALGNHVPLNELEQDADDVFAFHREVGCEYLTVAGIAADEIVRNADVIAKRLWPLAKKAKGYGISLLFHNHDDELLAKKGESEALELLMEATAATGSIALEPDLGWMEIGGGDCGHYLRKYAARCPVIHLKDYYSSNNALLGRVREFVPARGTKERGEFEFRPTGYGVLNLPKLMPLCLACAPEWFVIDHDLAYERDPYEDLKKSLDYTKGLVALLQPS
ncbi:MAG: sugar phosphate isomerase/epimerase [Christensenellaceae bacterium]|jgi:sugar phosphate isomerase/epimerase|nr:sugar phosphate isomerase/epimerase [Christensenellaceae bacterium]